MKKTVFLIALLALLAALTACGEVPAPAQTPAPAETPAVAETPAAAEAPAPAEAPAAESAFRFRTTTLGGETADESLFSGCRLTMVNFFEPWCPPCVAELPELEKLSENYAAEGLQILGVFSDEEGLEAVLKDAGVRYPVLRYVSAFDEFQTGYVPTTVFFNERGEIVGETVVGARSYEDWESVVGELLG